MTTFVNLSSIQAQPSEQEILRLLEKEEKSKTYHKAYMKSYYPVNTEKLKQKRIRSKYNFLSEEFFEKIKDPDLIISVGEIKKELDKLREKEIEMDTKAFINATISSFIFK